MNGIKLNNNT